MTKKEQMQLLLLGAVGVGAYFLTKQGVSYVSELAQQTKISSLGAAAIKATELFAPKAYNDPPGSALWSIGYGHQILPAEINSLLHATIDKTKADDLFTKDIAKYENAVAKIGVPMTQGQFDGLVSFCYNLGIGIFRNDKNGNPPPIVTLLKSGNMSAVGAKMREYNKVRVNGALVANAGLTVRRAAESAMFG